MKTCGLPTGVRLSSRILCVSSVQHDDCLP